MKNQGCWDLNERWAVKTFSFQLREQNTHKDCHVGTQYS